MKEGKRELVVGMEIHVELKTVSKMFCGCKNDPFAAPRPNIYTCPVCLGMPGGLPVPNRKAIEWTVLLGLALGADITRETKFDRKNYFYPDLPKGYQISQYDKPIARGGQVMTSFGPVRIHRVHLEEDTAKLLHTSIEGEDATLVDFNRSGVPLVEIVTEPDIRSGEQAREFLKSLHRIIRYLGISDADMEKGSMRLEPNISLREAGSTALAPYKVEVKNINSFSFVKKAIDYEARRQTELLDNGRIPVQETRGFDEAKGATVSQRTKETADDYRYFPDPDIPPVVFDEKYILRTKDSLPELPDIRRMRFADAYGLPDADAAILTDTPEMADYFEKLAGEGKLPAKTLANYLINRKPDIAKTAPHELIARITKETSTVLMPEAEVRALAKSVIGENPKAVHDYQSGKEQAVMFLVGAVMRKAGKRIDTNAVRTLLLEELGNALKA